MQDGRMLCKNRIYVFLSADKTCTCVVCVCEMPFMDDTHVIRAFSDKDP